MSNIKRTNATRSLRAVALAVLAIGFAATTSFPAAAHVAERAPQSTWQQKAHVDFDRADSIQRVSTAAAYPPPDTGIYPPPDYCDLPSAGCESYLAN